ncbi:efflux RND transporter periplasmic adaptor subunit [Balneatrix alpica]|uniref:Efflux RND transporter periplasmic adaptor subunit n=1 Tax=Balneatrix alpica TaxID=75684 RepID=A0ABV5ZEA4_9GAMM|nr:efflux RND transporter periplasmic adaptor subunit [Balneatrix alpica]
MQRSSSWLAWLSRLVGVALVLGSALLTLEAIEDRPVLEESAQPPSLPRVSVLALTPGEHSAQLQGYAEVQASEQIRLLAQVSGQVRWRHPSLVVGGEVQQGEVLVELEASRYEAALASAEQGVAEAKLALLQEQQQQQQAEQEWRRSGLSQQPSSLLLRQPQLQAAKARLTAAEKARAQAKQELASSRIRAPFAAVVSEVNIGLGSYVEAGTALASLKASEVAEMSLALSPAQWQLLPAQPLGLPVRIRDPQQGAAEWQGQVVRVAMERDQRTRQRRLIVALQQPLAQQPALLFGSFVELSLQGERQQQLFALPASALSAAGELWYVQGQSLQRQAVQPLFSQAGKVFVPQQGLPAPLLLVRHPLVSYLPGMRVQPQQEQQP